MIATHPDQALRLLAAPTPAERSVLGAFPYKPNEAVLHTDARLLPLRCRSGPSVVELLSELPRRRRRPGAHPGQLLPEPAAGPAARPRPPRLHRHARRPGGRGPGACHRRAGLRSPRLHARLGGRAARRLPGLRTAVTAFMRAPTTAGGSTRTGCLLGRGRGAGRSAAPGDRGDVRTRAWRADRARRPDVARPLAPGAALYECRVFHARRTPLRNAFSYRTYQWLVDVDRQAAVPARPGCGCSPGSDARDHLRRPGPQHQGQRRRVPARPRHRTERRPGADAGRTRGCSATCSTR